MAHVHRKEAKPSTGGGRRWLLWCGAALLAFFAIGLIVPEAVPETIPSLSPFGWMKDRRAKGARSSQEYGHRSAQLRTEAQAPWERLPIESTPTRSLGPDSLAGIHPIGDGYLVRLTPAGASTVKVEVLHDRDWRTNPQPGGRRYQFKSPPQGIGMPKTAGLHPGAAWELPLEWTDHGQMIHVHVGTPGDDNFRRIPGASRCLYIGLGGADRVTTDPGQLPEPFPNDVLLGLDGQACPIRWDSAPELGLTAETSGSGEPLRK